MLAFLTAGVVHGEGERGIEEQDRTPDSSPETALSEDNIANGHALTTRRFCFLDPRVPGVG